MAIKEKLMQLATVEGDPCVTISLNTHRTHPDSAVDRILLKDLVKEAENRLMEEYGKRNTVSLIEKLKKIRDNINENYNLDSLHIFLSDTVEEIIRIAWPTYENKVTVDKRFDLRSIIKDYNRTNEYMIMILSQGGVKLYHAMNDAVLEEIREDDFPFGETPWYAANMEERSNAPHMDNLLREFFNRVDKALIKVNNNNKMSCIVVCTEDNYSHLMQVADKPNIYIGHVAIDYNHTETHQIVKQTWPVIEELQEKQREDAISEMKEAVSQQKVVTDLMEIYQAAIDGRGDMLIVFEDYEQPVKMIDDRTFELAEDPAEPGIVDDIVAEIAREVFLKHGRVFFTCREDIKELGDIALKVRY